MHAPDETRLFRFSCELAPTDLILGIAAPPQVSTGQHITEAPARVAALAEAAERYSAFASPPDGIRLTTARAAGVGCALPESFALFHPRQYAEAGSTFRPFTSDTPVRWIDGFDVATGGRLLLPLQRIFIGASNRLAPGEAPITYATSNGTACGATLEEALLPALLEVVERDAVMIAWNSRVSPPQLEWRSDPALADFDDRYIAPSGLTYQALDLSEIAGLPTVLACVRGPGDAPEPLGFGASSALDIRDAWRKATAECFLVRTAARHLRVTTPDRCYHDYGEIEDFADHMVFYADRDHVCLTDFLFAAGERTSIGEAVAPMTVAEALKRVVEVVRSQGGDVLAADITPKDIASLGLTVAKVVVPQYCDLDTAFSARFLGGDRLYRRAHQVGWRQKALTFDDLNPDPHPFG
jgi:ribosomal protein S12 methylthiotransferase accessory factor